MSLDDAFRFGKNKGISLQDVLEEDYTYVEWLMNESDLDFAIDNEAYSFYEKVKSCGQKDMFSDSDLPF